MAFPVITFMDEKRLESPRYFPRRPLVSPVVLCILMYPTNLIAVVLGILLGLLLAGLSSLITAPSDDCPAPLPLDPLYRHPLLQNDTRLKAAEQELSGVLHDKLSETDSAVVIVVHGEQTLL